MTNWDGKRGQRPAPREIDLFESVNAHPGVERVAQLPATAMAASAQCFAVAARDLQLRAGRFQGGFAGLY